MLSHRYQLIVFLICMTIFSCSKDELLIHENLTISGNKSKDYHGISTVLVENYVNKIYIDLIGLKPTYQELTEAVETLEASGLSFETRASMIRSLMLRTEYFDRFFQISSGLLLNGFSREEIEQFWLEYQAVRNLVYQTGDTLLGQFLDYEISKLEDLLNAPEAYRLSEINLSEYYYRMCYNAIYDEINMGSENFVKACFENFFKRYPTVEELQRGVTMVDGGATSLLLQDGSNKIDFVEIVTSDKEFFEGRILDVYESLLLREPTSTELAEATKSFVADSDFQNVQVEIMKTDEYAGFE